MSDYLLEVKGLKTYFQAAAGRIKAVDGVDFTVSRGETLGIVGESGCGKSVTSLTILQLIQCPPGEYAGGRILFKGVNLLDQNEKYMRTIRGNDIAMIFQEPMTSLNPAYTIGRQIGEPLRLHKGLTKKDTRSRTTELLKMVGIPAPDKRLDEYPHQLSGGMRQRVMIAMALSCDPDLLIADEPTTALDVTIQAQILELMKRFKKEIGTAVMLISHDLGVIAEVSDRVAVMYAGKVVEYSHVRDIFKKPLHPYTIGLHKSIPRLEDPKERELEAIRGNIPDPGLLPPGCKFQPRCDFSKEECLSQEPDLIRVDGDHLVRCWLFSS